jgi:hypothetical protein
MASAAGNALALIKAVLELCVDRRTGVLDVRSDGLHTRITFDDGKPVFAEDEAPGESFGRLLMRQGVINNDQFVWVIDEMTRAAAGNNQLRFGEVALGLGVLTPEQVQRGLADQVCGIITRALQRGESEWTFDTAPGAARPPSAFSLQVNPAILEAACQSSDRSVVADVVAARPQDFVLVAGPHPPAGVAARVDEGGGAASERPPETHAARMAAEQAFQQGLALLRETKMASAAMELRRASELQPESLEYLLYATWAKARSYREIPIESDQQALLDVAQRAKRRDPMLAFASYVIGQVAMWGGDDATAKKWFYEALRLDPSSEAGKQVRILARHAAPAAPGGPPADARDHDRTGERDPVPATGPAASRAPAGGAPAPAPAPPGRWVGRLLLGVALLAIGAVAILAVARWSAPQAQPAPVVAAEPAPAVDASPPVALEQQRAIADAGADEEPGMVLLPARAAGHRIFVDGRRAKTEGTEPLRLRCGKRVIQIGSSGTPEEIQVPCGGEVQLQ